MAQSQRLEGHSNWARGCQPNGESVKWGDGEFQESSSPYPLNYFSCFGLGAPVLCKAVLSEQRAGLASWACNLGSCTGIFAWFDALLLQSKFFLVFEQGSPRFYFAVGPTNYRAVGYFLLGSC